MINSGDTSFPIKANDDSSLSQYESNIDCEKNIKSPEKKDNKIKLFKKRGNMYIFGERKTTEKKISRWVVVGPDWPCGLITHVMVSIPCILLNIFVIRSEAGSIILYILFGFASLLLSWILLCDPGIVKRHSKLKTIFWTYCEHCESFRPPKSSHCNTCQVCILDRHHHCPWVGKCIGKKIFTSFKLFIVSIVWLFIYAFVVIILNFVKVNGKKLLL